MNPNLFKTQNYVLKSGDIVIDFSGCCFKKDVFVLFGTSLNFEIVPTRKWGAFTDGFRSFCSYSETSVSIFIKGWSIFEGRNKTLAKEFEEVIGNILKEHNSGYLAKHSFVSEDYQIPEINIILD